MPEQPIGKLDHIGIAVRSAAEARKFFEGALGARFLYEHANPEAGYRIFEFEGITAATPNEPEIEAALGARIGHDQEKLFQAGRQVHGRIIALRRRQVWRFLAQLGQIGDFAMERRGPLLVLGPLLANPRIEELGFGKGTIGAAEKQRAKRHGRQKTKSAMLGHHGSAG